MNRTIALPSRGLPAPNIARDASQLSRKAKAAIIVQLLLTEGADVPLSALPEEHQAELTLLLGHMRYVDRDTLNVVVEEFAAELEGVGLRFPGDIAGALTALDGKISARTAMRLRKEAGVRQTGDPWKRINELPVDKLAALVSQESIQVAAVMMSKIDVTKAAQVLVKLPGDRARQISFAVSKTTGVTPDAVDRIGLSIAAQLDAEPPKAFAAKPDERLGEILNYSNANTRESLLGALEQEDAAFATAVRKAIFTFEKIPERIKPNDVAAVLRDLEPITIATAFAAADTDGDRAAVDFIRANISKRMAATYDDEAEALGEVRARDGERAMTEIIASIRRLVDMGEIELVRPEEDEEGAA
jgi:flagellar motor switch protein FliG